MCVTCIGAGGGILDKGMPAFQCVLLDEAAQATEAASLVPVVKGCKSLVMCGDHHQLPPTILHRGKQHQQPARTFDFWDFSDRLIG